MCWRTRQRFLTRPLTVCLLQGLDTMGALDLGGASTQISFVSDGFVGSESPNNSITFRLYGNDYNLYTHSFLCYGKDQALRLTLAQQTKVDSVIQEPLPVSPLLNPPSVSPSQVHKPSRTRVLTPAMRPPGTTRVSTPARVCRAVRLRAPPLASLTRAPGTSLSARTSSKASSAPPAASTANVPSTGSSSHFYKGNLG